MLDVIPCFKIVLFTVENWFRIPSDSSDLLDNVSTGTVSMGTPATPSGGKAGKLRFLPPYNVEEYIHLHLPKIDARSFAIMPSGEMFVMRTCPEEQETAFAFAG